MFHRSGFLSGGFVDASRSLRRIFRAALVLLVLVTGAVAGDVTTALPYVEVSVHDEQKVSALMVWKVGDKNSVYELARPFSMEWVVPPDGASAFMIFPLGTADLKSQKWIPLKNDEKLTGAQNIHISIRLDSGRVPVVDADYAEKTLNGIPSKQMFQRVPAADMGWCYVGNWDPGDGSWKSIYWVDAADASLLGKRRRVETPPTALTGVEIVADFPVRLRSEASSASPEIAIGQHLRPGVKVKVLEVRYDVDSRVHGVWAKISIVK